ncbi:oligosaccharide flippase family protein [Sporosarcina saromensis]|uniref:Oligosaccharide flippase family protein n=1 Tax=Sporosarcina saromensis TaxID=359365 RepID=A0ABU4GCD1_9BACL|nr:oligosaccharide flippase family protein [Sporosarcina saromensis]MDW0114032.1 oligosaccharide flippase family protein [Sporosarcina saromensis]
MKKSIFKNVIYKITLNFFNLVVPLLIGPYVFRALGSEAMGRVKYGESIFKYFFIFAAFGIYQYGIREISKVKNDKEKVAKLFTSLFTISLITNGIFLVVYLIVSKLSFGDEIIFPILIIFSLNFIFNIFYVEWINEAFESYDFITIKTIIVKIIYVILLFVFVQNADDYLWFAGLLVISAALNNIISFVYVKRKLNFDFKGLKLLSHIKPLFLVVIFLNGNILYTQLDIFMLGRFVSEKSVSFYIMSQQIMMIISMLMLSIVQVTIPRLAFLLGTQDDTAYITLIEKVARVYFMLLFPAAVGLYIIADIGVVVYGGSEFTGAGSVLAIFSLYMILIGIDSILSNQVIYVKNKESMLVRFIFISGVVNLLLNILFLNLGYFTPETAIGTTAFSTLLLIAMELIYIRKSLKVPFRLITTHSVKYLVFALVFFPVAYVIKQVTDGIFIQFILIIAVSVLVYAFLLIISKDEMLYELLKRITSKVKRNKT